MHPPHQTRDARALAYLSARNALWKLSSPVPCLFTGDQRHGEAMRRKNRQTPRRSRRLAAWGIPFALLSLNHR